MKNVLSSVELCVSLMVGRGLYLHTGCSLIPRHM